MQKIIFLSSLRKSATAFFTPNMFLCMNCSILLIVLFRPVNLGVSAIFTSIFIWYLIDAWRFEFASVFNTYFKSKNQNWFYTKYRDKIMKLMQTRENITYKILINLFYMLSILGLYSNRNYEFFMQRLLQPRHILF